MSDADVSHAKEAFHASLGGFGAPEASADVKRRKKAEEAASKTKPPKPGTKRKKGSTIGLRCTTKVKLIALRAQEIRAANTISDSIEMAILKDAADLGIKEAADLLLELEREEQGG